MKMRSMEECKLVDCVELSPKSIDDFDSALIIVLESGLNLYLDQFVISIIMRLALPVLCLTNRLP